MDLFFLERARELLSALPARAKLAIMCAIAFVAVAFAIDRHGAAVERERIAMHARRDSLAALTKEAIGLHAADSLATIHRSAATRDVDAARQRREQPGRAVVVLSDTTVRAKTSAGADTTIVVAAQVATALRDLDAQVRADSVVIVADSAKIDAQSARQPVDSAIAALDGKLTKPPDVSAIPADRLGHVVVETGKIVLVAAVVVKGAQFVLSHLHH